MDQAEGRVHRIGSEAEAINAYWLAGEGTFDQDMIELIEDKRAIAQAAIVGEGEGVATDIVTWFAGLAGRFSNEGSR
jgi:SNF2 family DNA or RNA helicase